MISVQAKYATNPTQAGQSLALQLSKAIAFFKYNHKINHLKIKIRSFEIYCDHFC